MSAPSWAGVVIGAALLLAALAVRWRIRYDLSPPRHHRAARTDAARRRDARRVPPPPPG